MTENQLSGKAEPKIKFSHQYLKFDGNEMPFSGKILQIFVCDRKELSQAFIDYDTVYKNEYEAEGWYPLPNGKLIVILICTDGHFAGNGSLFTTIRRYTPEKWTYYSGLVGKKVEICKS